MFNSIFRWLFCEPKEWKVVGYTKEIKEVITKHYWSGSVHDSCTFRLVVLENQYKEREIKVNWIHSSKGLTYTEAYDLNNLHGIVWFSKQKINDCCSEMSTEKFNSKYDEHLVKYSESKWTFEKFKNEFIFNDNDLNSIDVKV